MSLAAARDCAQYWARPRSRLVWFAGGLGVLGLLTYPLPLAWLGMAALFAVAAVRPRRAVEFVRASPFSWSLGLYLLGGGLGLYLTFDLQGALVRFFGLLAAVAAHFLIVGGVRSARAARCAVSGGLIGAVLAAPLILLLAAPTLDTARMPELLSMLLAGPKQIGEPLRAAVVAAVVDVSQLGQRYRLYGSGLGAFAAYGLGLALGPFLAGQSQRERTAGGLGVAYFGCFVLLAGSRTALMSAGFTLLVLGAVRYRWLRPGALLALGAALALLVYFLPGEPLPGQQFLPRFADSGTFLMRLEFWRNALFLLGDYRFTGVGLGFTSASEVLKQYFPSPSNKDLCFCHVHNSYIQSYLEQGLPGAIGIVGVVVAGLGVGWRALSDARDPLLRCAAISASGGALALGLAGLGDVVFVTALGQVLLFGTLGLLAAVGRQVPSPNERRSTRAARAWRGRRTLAVSLSLILVLATAGSLLAASAAYGIPDNLLAPRLVQPLRPLVAGIYLNQGALEFLRSAVPPGKPGEQQHLMLADDRLRRALMLDPENSSIYRNLAMVALRQSRRVEAGEALSAAEAFAPLGDSRLFFQLGRLYRQNRDVDRAIAMWSRVSPSLDRWTDAGPATELSRWADERIQRQSWNNAMKLSLAAIQAAPSDPRPYDSYAAAARRQLGEEAALDRMRELVDKYPKVPWPYLEVGDQYRRLGRFAEATESYRQAAGLSAQDPRVWLRLADR